MGEGAEWKQGLAEHDHAHAARVHALRCRPRGHGPGSRRNVASALPPPNRHRRHGSELPLEIERLWSTLAGNRRNIIPVLDFLVSLGMHVAFQVRAKHCLELGTRPCLAPAHSAAPPCCRTLLLQTPAH